MSTWTYGAEHELSDWDRSKELPRYLGIDTRDVTMVNRNGIAVDPKGTRCQFGGEINTSPTDTVDGQLEQLNEFLVRYPETSINYRSNLHIHVCVPGLEKDLKTLKRLQLFIHAELPKVIDLIDPIPKPGKGISGEVLKGALRRSVRNLVSHHTFLPENRIEKQQGAKTVEEFHKLGVPADKRGRPQWQCQPREAVSLRQLMQTKTIEFRHFFGTLDTARLSTAFAWCCSFLKCALNNGDLVALYELKFKNCQFPTSLPYIHWIENRYRATCFDGSVSKADRVSNTQKILNGEFDEHPLCMPRKCMSQPVS